MRHLIACLLVAAPLNAATPAEWLDDFHFILGEIASHYANIDSVIADRHVDLDSLKKKTEERIQAATSDRDAQAAIDQYLAAFGDGHAFVDWKPSTSTPGDARKLCERLGYTARPFGGIDFASLPEFTAIADSDSSDFPGGILRTPAGKAGVIRIHLFSEHAHPELCAAVQKSRSLAEDAPCTGDCRHDFDRAVADQLTAALERRITSLRSAGATAIVVDLTGNGGGSDWVEVAARVLSPVALKSPRMGFIRHEHWVKDFRERLADIDADLKTKPDDKLLRSAAAKLQKNLEEASRPRPANSPMVVMGNIYAAGMLPYAKAGSLDSYQSKGVLFQPSLYSYHEGTNGLPLLVLTDGRTASASELFSAMLQDNRAAVIVGTPTLGAGCGHTNGGIAAKLPHSGAELSLPDCVRFRSDGSNEIVGVVPDVLIPWHSYDSPFQRASKARNALDRAMRIRNSGKP